MTKISYDINERNTKLPKLLSDADLIRRKVITPLGAAIVEALPDRKAVRYIKRRFRERGQVPVSSLFNAEQISAFYGECDMEVKSVPRGVRPSSNKCPCLTSMSPQCGPACWHHGKGTNCGLCDNTGTAIRRDSEAEEGEQSK